MSASNVCILCATYNGMPYVREQIASIQAQTHRHWQLLIRDDGSTDGTLDALVNLARSDRRIQIVDDGLGNQGAAQNFARLLEQPEAAAARRLMFADQDDVWHEDKIAQSLDALEAAEAALGPDVPILVHTDLEVVDADLRPLHGSFMQFQHLQPHVRLPLKTLLMQNLVTGCTVMFNQALRRIAVPIPGEAVLHDWWLALCAAATGQIEFVARPTIRYRQHASNAVGAQGFWRSLLPTARPWSRLGAGRNAVYLKQVWQAQALASRLTERAIEVPGDAQAVLNRFLQLHRPEVSRATRLFGLHFGGIRNQGLIRNLLMTLRLLRIPSESFVLPEKDQAADQLPLTGPKFLDRSEQRKSA